ncbi:amidohydrolase [Jejubacter calystegiae]|uniref:Amidohydrolase n=1 Tax=Jejubacter calystegiae TaxID=2579935 RepID=A0A4P8YJE4_9ENTR|nr:amidohydrolase [Jejubacter calystegiae]QCT20855.1 amidohydrolase [Jejubacter calystegiae]
MTFNPDWQRLYQQMCDWRAAIHRYPELSHQETATTEYIVQQLSTFPALQITRPAPTGVVVRLKGAHPGRTIAFRADIDALPVTEKTGLPFQSIRPGLMHACGHDMHTAMLMGAASMLADCQQRLKGEILFIFQRGEEMSPGGAKELVESGALQGVGMFFALHVLPALACGTIALKRGIATANRDTFNIRLQGKGGHSSMPHLLVDPCVAAAETLLALQTIVSREVNPRDSAVLSVCSLVCGDGTTAAIPDDARLCGTNRTFSVSVRRQLKQAITRIVQGVALAHRCDAEVIFDDWDYSAIVNDEGLCDIAADVIRHLVGESGLRLEPEPMCVGEDFSEYQALAPVCFAWLGVGSGQGEQPALHNAHFNPRQEAMLLGLKYYVELARRLVMS